MLTLIGLIWPLAARSYSGRATVGGVAAGAAAHLIVAVFGVAVGSLGTRGVLPRARWTVLVASALCLADVVTPHAPPTRRILELFDKGSAADLTWSLTGVGAQTAVLAAPLVTGSLAVARLRS